MAQLTCRDLTLGYEGNPVIEHLSFSVNAGDYLYIVGRTAPEEHAYESAAASEISHGRNH